MRKLKKSLKKRKGLEAKIARQEFLHALKHGKPEEPPLGDTAQEILKKIRNRRNHGVASPSPSPYDASTNGMMRKIRRMAGLE